MGKRSKGKKGKKRPAMTRRDPKAKKPRSEAEPVGASDDGSEEGGQDDAESEPGSGADATASEPSAEAADAADSDAVGPKTGGAAGASEGGSDDEGAEGESDDWTDEERAPIGLPGGAEWALAVARVDRRWVWLETRIMFAALVLLTLSLCLFFAMRGMKEPLQAEEVAGTVLRAMLGAIFLGGLARLLTRRRGEKVSRPVTIVAVLVGLGIAPLWRGVGIDYWDGIFDWLQGGSTLTLFGGLWGLSTRLTMFVAMLGASIAAASGTHINIDVLVRLIPRIYRRVVGTLAACATAVVCFAASYGFVDHIAITGFGADEAAPMSKKLGSIGEGLDEMFFAWRKQVVLDAGAVPYVLAGERWDHPERMDGAAWNEWLVEEGYPERYGQEAVEELRAPEGYLDEPWVPFVQLPEHDPRSGFLKEVFDLLTWPLGFLILGLKFILRGILIASGHVSTRIEGEKEDEGGEPAEEGA